MSEKKSTAKGDAGTRRVADLQPGTYTDGHPLDEVHYLESKLILKGDRFTSRETFFDFAKLVRRAADGAGVDFCTRHVEALRPQIREVLFLDTEGFRLYNNAFILRRRTIYEDGFLVGDPEVVLKFRHPDMQTAAAVDVRPNISGDYKVKFKAEALPLKDKIGGVRLLFSHNVEFPLSHMHGDLTSMATLVQLLPALRTLKSARGKVELVNRTAVEEVLQELGTLDFGKGVEAPSNATVWRSRGDERQLVGEFSFQCKFKRRDELHDKAMKRCEQFFVSLQHVARDWIALGTTKTGAVYRLKGNPPQAHE